MTRTAHVTVLLTIPDSDWEYEDEEKATWAASKEIQFMDEQSPQRVAQAYASEWEDVQSVEVKDISVSETVYQ